MSNVQGHYVKVIAYNWKNTSNMLQIALFNPNLSMWIKTYMKASRYGVIYLLILYCTLIRVPFVMICNCMCRNLVHV